MTDKTTVDTLNINFCGTKTEAVDNWEGDDRFKRVRFVLLNNLNSLLKEGPLKNKISALEESLRTAWYSKMANQMVTSFIQNLSKPEKELIQQNCASPYHFPSDLYNLSYDEETKDNIKHVKYDGCQYFPGFLGAVNAWGMKQPVDLAVKSIADGLRQHIKDNPPPSTKTFKINSIAWSRGAVGAMYMAKKLKDVLSKEELSRLEVHLDIRDPVPGNLRGIVNMGSFGPRFGNLVADLSDCDYIKSVKIAVGTKVKVPAEQEPFYDFLIPKLPKTTTVELNVVPGGHKAEVKENYYDLDSERMEEVRNGITGIGKIGGIREKEAHSKYIGQQIENEDEHEYFVNPDEYNKWRDPERVLPKDYYPKFLFGSRRLYHDSNLSIVNAIEKPLPSANNDALFTASYQRLMLQLDLLKFRLKNDLIVADRDTLINNVNDIQNQLKKIASSEKSPEGKCQDMLGLLENNKNTMGRKVNQCIDYILNDKDELFFVDRVKNAIANQPPKDVIQVEMNQKQPNIKRVVENFLKLNLTDRNVVWKDLASKFQSSPEHLKEFKSLLKQNMGGYKQASFQASRSPNSELKAKWQNIGQETSLYADLEGDQLKTAILGELKKKIDGAKNSEELKNIEKECKTELELLEKPQGRTTQLLSFALKTDSIIAFRKMVSEKEKTFQSKNIEPNAPTKNFSM